ncbi:hypothetical protein GCM10023318_47030 [Nocardia callitridis]|uniref:Cyclic pyranopterin monophosphate synthase n=1 Tax=Nocardia callitridis TaxID=648753 RepID=A0ABP9KPE0_9NOCA
MSELSHVDGEGRARMVDVSAKSDTTRIARAAGELRTTAEVVRLVRANDMPKADVLATARIAGISGAKKTAELIPLCHQLALSSVQVRFGFTDDTITIEATAKTKGPTGVEMEALTAVAVAGLTLHDMVKAVDPAASVNAVRLLTKEGGKRGHWRRPGAEDAGAEDGCATPNPSARPLPDDAEEATPARPPQPSVAQRRDFSPPDAATSTASLAEVSNQLPRPSRVAGGSDDTERPPHARTSSSTEGAAATPPHAVSPAAVSTDVTPTSSQSREPDDSGAEQTHPHSTHTEEADLPTTADSDNEEGHPATTEEAHAHSDAEQSRPAIDPRRRPGAGRCAVVLVVSTGAAAGTRTDTTGPVLADWLATLGFSVRGPLVYADDEIGFGLADALRFGPELLITTGGTGVSPTDATPEATLAVLDRELPGIAEAIRRRGAEKFPLATLSRGVVGQSGPSIVVNLPGSPGGVRDGIAVLAPLLDHLLAQVAGGGDHDNH